MKQAERGELKHLSWLHAGCGFTGLICPEWFLTPLKAHILPMHLNPSWIFRWKKKTSPNKSGVSLRVEMKKKEKEGTGWSAERAGGRKEEEDVGSSPSHACVSVLVCRGTDSVFHPPNQAPPPPEQSRVQEASYSVRHSDRVAGEAATATRITRIMSHTLQERLWTGIGAVRW